jgi:urocanate hydratase
MQLRSHIPTRRVFRTVSTLFRVMAPSLIALSFATMAYAQGTMDFSGAQTLMGTFKTFTAFVRRADEGTLSRLLVEASILLAASRSNPTAILKEAAATYKVDTDAITTKVRQEFAAKEKARKATQPAVKSATKAA